MERAKTLRSAKRAKSTKSTKNTKNTKNTKSIKSIKTTNVKPTEERFPEWILQKHETSLAAIHERTEAIFTNLSDGLFQRLESEGGFPICTEVRNYIAELMTLPLPKLPGPTLVPLRKQQLAKDAEMLAEAIEADLSAADFLVTSPTIELPLRLREYAHSIDPPPGVSHKVLFDLPGPELNTRLKLARQRPRPPGDAGRPFLWNDDFVIEMMAEVYHRIGGRVAYSRNGPFVRFLKVIWEVLPRSNRSSTANAFARRAQLLIPVFRKRVRTLPRAVTGKPWFR